MLTQLALLASTRLENALLYEREHRVAETLQRSLLPESLPELRRRRARRPLPARAERGHRRRRLVRRDRARRRRSRWSSATSSGAASRPHRRWASCATPCARTCSRATARPDARPRQPAARHARRRLRDARLPVLRHDHRRAALRQRGAPAAAESRCPTARRAGSTAGWRRRSARRGTSPTPRREDRPAAGERARALHRRPRRAPQGADRRRARAARRGGGRQPRPRRDARRPARLGDARHGPPRRRRGARALPARGRGRAVRVAAPGRGHRHSGRCANGCAAGSTPRASTVARPPTSCWRSGKRHRTPSSIRSSPTRPRSSSASAPPATAPPRSRSATTAAGTTRRRRPIAGAGCRSCARSTARSPSTARQTGTTVTIHHRRGDRSA